MTRSPKTIGIGITCVLSTVAVLGAIVPAFAQSGVESSDALFEKGSNLYDQGDYNLATMYLYAYIQRQPPALVRDSNHRSQLESAVAYAIKRVDLTVRERDEFMKKAAECTRSDGLGQHVSGLTQQAPPLDPPAMTASAVKRCDVYARIAVAQNDASVANECSFSGPRWHSTPQYHYDWCVAVPRASAYTETTERQRMLSECTD